jgi:hypothetical protein
MSVGNNIYVEFGIPPSTMKSISQDLFPLVGGTATSQCRLGADFSNKRYGDILSYTYLQGNGADIGYSIAVGSNKYVYITGQYSSTITLDVNDMGLPPSASGSTFPSGSGNNMFVLKHNEFGSLISYTYLRGTGSDIGYGIAVDSNDNVYIIGQYTSTTNIPINTMDYFSPSPTGYTLPSGSGTNMFVLKYDEFGSLISYTYLQGTGTDIGYGIAVDSDQNVYITGQYNSTTNIPINTMSLTPSSTGVNLPSSGGTNMFVLKYNSSGGIVSYTYLQGNNGTDTGRNITVDSDQNVYITGQYVSSINIPINTMSLTPSTTGYTLPVSGSSNHMFALKYDVFGSLTLFTKIEGVGPDNIGYGIAVDSSNNIYITGQYNVSNFNVPIATMGLPPVYSGYTLPFGEGINMFVLKYNSSGSLVSYTYVRGTGTDTGRNITVDSDQNVYITGEYFATTNINTMSLTPSPTGYTLPAGSGTNMFVLKYNASGGIVSYTYLNGNGTDIGRNITVDSDQNVYITGEYLSSGVAVNINTMSFAPSPTGYTLPASGTSNMFALKYIKT